MEEKVYIKWTYTPEDYFEAHAKQQDLYILEIDSGLARATLVSSNYDKDNLELIHEQVKAYFKGAQVASHKLYNLSRYTLRHQHSDGSITESASPPPVVINLKIGAVRCTGTDSTGNIIADTKEDSRKSEMLKLSELAAKYCHDLVAKNILRSYEACVKDPDNELVHLYEIREALKKFKNGKAGEELRISNKNWERLGDLSNNAPLRQGRHRGKHSELRDATDEELAEARDIAKRMVIAYLEYLEYLDKVP